MLCDAGSYVLIRGSESYGSIKLTVSNGRDVGKDLKQWLNAVRGTTPVLVVRAFQMSSFPSGGKEIFTIDWTCDGSDERVIEKLVQRAEEIDSVIVGNRSWGFDTAALVISRWRLFPETT